MGVPRSEDPASEVLAVGQVQGEGDHRFRNPSASEIGINKDVAQPGECLLVGDDSAVADLSIAFVNAHHVRRIPGRPLHFRAVHTGAPVGGGEPRMDEVEIDAGKFVVDLERAVA